MKNDLISLSNVVCEALQLGMSMELTELGSLRLTLPSKMMDSAAEITVKDALKTPKIVFTPKQKMRDAAQQGETDVDRGTVASASSETVRKWMKVAEPIICNVFLSQLP